MVAIEVDVAVIGGGIAGASAAAHIAQERSVVLLEREDQPGYHASGRSAALFSESYGNATVRALTVGSRAFLETPPAGFAEHPLLAPRGVLHVGTAGHEQRLAALGDEIRVLVPGIRAMTAAEARGLVPVLRPEWVVGGVFEPDARDIDTNALLQGFLRLLKAAGGQVLTRAEATGFARDGGRWVVDTRVGRVRAGIVVDAAGAWCDEVAAMAGVAPIGLVPKRRTAFLFEPPAGVDARGWPAVVGIEEDFYFKPDAGLIIGSPADETPSPPTDAQPEELDVAVAVDRIETVADLPVRRIVRRWAGLRTFAPDKTPVVGFDPSVDGFFWLAGQGGYGFQTAPAMGRTAASLVAGRDVADDLRRLGVTAAALAPDRFRPRRAAAGA